MTGQARVPVLFSQYTKLTDMRKLLFSLVMLVLPMISQAQTTIKYGYLSYQEVLKFMPEYAVAQTKLADLKQKYDNEMKRVEDEFNKKYEQFLEGQKDFAPTILRKRQVELQELIAKNIAFKEEAKRLLAQAETESYAPLKAKLAETLRGIGEARGFMFVLNTDNDNLPYVNSAFGEDITTLVKECLQ